MLIWAFCIWHGSLCRYCQKQCIVRSLHTSFLCRLSHYWVGQSFQIRIYYTCGFYHSKERKFVRRSWDKSFRPWISPPCGIVLYNYMLYIIICQDIIGFKGVKKYIKEQLILKIGEH